MKQIPRISETEWQVMKVLWANAPAAANQVIESLADSTTWKPKTVKTLLSRLVKKKAVGFKKDNRTYHYYPLLTEDECVRAESRSFLKRVYSGALNVMIASFLEEENLSKEDIDELQRILDERKTGR